jgi:hypothetical protein
MSETVNAAKDTLALHVTNEASETRKSTADISANLVNACLAVGASRKDQLHAIRNYVTQVYLRMQHEEIEAMKGIASDSRPTLHSFTDRVEKLYLGQKQKMAVELLPAQRLWAALKIGNEWDLMIAAESHASAATSLIGELLAADGSAKRSVTHAERRELFQAIVRKFSVTWSLRHLSVVDSFLTQPEQEIVT